MAVCQNLVPLVNIKIAGKWMFIPLKMVCIGIDPDPPLHTSLYLCHVMHLFSAPDIIQDTDGRLDRHNDKIDGFALAA